MANSIPPDLDKIEAKEANYLFVATSQLMNAGMGLFSTIEIYKDEIIATFKGEILTNEQALKRADLGLDAYFISMLDGSIMDSRTTACFAKYANDSNGVSQALFKNNAKIMIDDDHSICLVATKKIKEGAEIFCDYGIKYWKNQQRQLADKLNNKFTEPF